jgi:hypothetical protein
VNDVASVLADVEKVDLDVSMLRDAADVFLNVSDCFRMLRVLFLNVAESHVEPSIRDPCCRYVMLSVVEGRTTPDVDVANIHFQYCGC